jgi:hypothetical protein
MKLIRGCVSDVANNLRTAVEPLRTDVFGGSTRILSDHLRLEACFLSSGRDGEVMKLRGR